MGGEAIYEVCECGYSLNKHVFGEPYIHPAAHEGPPVQPWSKEKGDLSSAVVVMLSFGGRTARSFLDGLINNRGAGTGPLGLLAITGAPIDNVVQGAQFPTKMVPYNAIRDPHTISWVTQLNPGKVVILDFGGRDDSVVDLAEALKQHIPSIDKVTVGVGMDAKVGTQEETMKTLMSRGALPNRIQMNTGPIREALVDKMGAEAYFQTVNKEWAGFVDRGNLNNLRIIWGEGVKGDLGMEGSWQTICRGKLLSNAAFVYRL